MKEKISILEDSIKKLLSYSIVFFIIIMSIGFIVMKSNYDDEIQRLEENYEKQLNLSSNEELNKELESIKKYLRLESKYIEQNSKDIIDSVYNLVSDFYKINNDQILNLLENTKYPIEIKTLDEIEENYKYYAKYIKLNDNKYLKISLNEQKYKESQEQLAIKNAYNLHTNSYINFNIEKLKNDFDFTNAENWYCEYKEQLYTCYDKTWQLKLTFNINSQKLSSALEDAKERRYKTLLSNIIFLICAVLLGYFLLYVYIVNRKKEVKTQIELLTSYFSLILNNQATNFNKRNKLNLDFKYKEFRTLSYIFLNFLRTIKVKDKNLKKQVYVDNVTGLMNTTSVYEALGFYQAKEDKVLLFCFFNIENFRIYNSMYGRDFGDEVLKVVGFRIYTILKNLEINEDEYTKSLEYKKYEKYSFEQNNDKFECLARISADEFLLIIEVEKAENYEKIVKKYHHDLTQKNITIDSNDDLIQYDPFKINARIGYSVYPKDSKKILECIGNADMAIENEKASGGNGIFGYTEDIGKQNEKYLQLQKDIRNGILNKEFILHYQPKVDCKTGKIMGAEALVRWQKGSKIIMPDIFIEVCEKSNLIIALGNEIIRMACDAQRRWISQGLRLKLSINLSTKQLLSDGIIQVIEKNIQGIDPSLLEFEITESFSIENETSKEIIDKIKKLNVGLSMDDFGKGYSSLSYLNDKDLDFDVIKIDKCFIQNIDTNEKNRKLVEFIVNLIKTLNKRSVAEGVENLEILSFLQELGCDEYQGYYFSKPIPEEILLEKVHNNGQN